jgi:hypothetical protein
MKRNFLVFVMIISSFVVEAQFDTILLKKNVYASVDSMIAIFKRKDWNTYSTFMNPVLIEMMGGKDAFVLFLQEQMKVLENANVQIYKSGRILQFLKTKDQYQCIVESFMQMKIDELIVSGSSYDIGNSNDGKIWTFFRITETVTPAQIKELFPELSPEFKLPRSQMQPGKTLEEFISAYNLQYLD